MPPLCSGSWRSSSRPSRCDSARSAPGGELRTRVLGRSTLAGVQKATVTISLVQALLVFFVIPMVLGFWAQHRVKSTFAKNLQVPVANGMTGAQIARRVLDANGLNEVPVEETPGSLSDHYDPRSRSVHLSPEVFRAQVAAAVLVFRALTFLFQIPLGGLTYLIWRAKKSWLKPVPTTAQQDLDLASPAT